MIAWAIVILALIVIAVWRLWSVYGASVDDPHDYWADDARNPEDDK